MTGTDAQEREAVLRREGRRHDRERTAASLGIIILMPVLTGLLGNFSNTLWQQDKGVCIALWVAALFVWGVLYFRATPSTKSFVGLAISHERLESKISDLSEEQKRLSASIERLTSTDAFVFASRLMSTFYLLEGFKSRGELREALADIAAPLHLQGEYFFGFAGCEMWNFAVYLYSKESDVLTPVWRERSPTHPGRGPGREWGRGRGHIGKAFVDQQAIITADASDPAVAPFLLGTYEDQRSYDADVYRSFVSIPILHPENEMLPYGVVIATSDRAGRFNRENALILVHFAEVVANLVTLGDIDIDLIPSRVRARRRKAKP